MWDRGPLDLLRERFSELLGQAQALGHVGPGAVVAHVDHGLAFAETLAWAWSRDGALGATEPTRADAQSPTGATRHPETIVDLGSGAGLPGLVLASVWEDVGVVLVEAQERRASFLRESVRRMSLEDRVRVACERAELLGRSPLDRGMYDAVVARSFGRPAVTAECAAPFLKVGGVLVVSEPPSPADSEVRWPSSGLAQLGMGPSEAHGRRFHFRVVVQQEPCPDRFPRRVGVPAKHPAF
jgi:16S rRNA (guanine527-N7)-methyltransferase